MGALATPPALAEAQSVALAPAADTTIYVEGPLGNGAGQGVFSGTNGLGDTRRGLIRFELEGHVPPGATILSVRLRMSVQAAATAEPAVFSLHSLQRAWGEGPADAPGGEGAGTPALAGDATYACAVYDGSDCETPWMNAGADFDVSPVAVTTLAGVGTYTWQSNPELVADVQRWLDAPYANHGWLILGPEDVPARARRFASREGTPELARPLLTIEYCGDSDGDGFVDVACGGDDCDDRSALAHPGLTEVMCDGLDNDCLTETRDDADDDGDGVSVCSGDCDDGNPQRRPGLREVCDDGLDNDCDASTADVDDLDADGASCLIDCDDDDPTRTPGEAERCGDGVDNDCDEQTPDLFDADDDGALCDIDCDDASASVRPGLIERCDANDVDEDCSGQADDADPAAVGQQVWFEDPDGDGVGDSRVQRLACDAPAGFVPAASGPLLVGGACAAMPGARHTAQLHPAWILALVLLSAARRRRSS